MSALHLDAIEQRVEAVALEDWSHGVCYEDLVADLRALIARVRELEARVARVRAVHWPFTIYDDCGHDHKPEDAGVIDVDDIGLVCGYGKVYDICASCCADDRESQSENCLGHDHGLGHPICATIAALDEVSA